MHFLGWVLSEVVLALLFHRDKHPLIVLAYGLALPAGIILVCAVIASTVPDPFR